MSDADDLTEEGKARASYTAEHREEAEKLLVAMADLLEGKEAALVMNVATSLLVGLYIDNYGELGLQYLLDKVAHNYRVRMRPKGALPQ